MEYSKPQENQKDLNKKNNYLSTSKSEIIQ